MFFFMTVFVDDGDVNRLFTVMQENTDEILFLVFDGKTTQAFLRHTVSRKFIQHRNFFGNIAFLFLLEVGDNHLIQFLQQHLFAHPHESAAFLHIHAA